MNNNIAIVAKILLVVLVIHGVGVIAKSLTDVEVSQSAAYDTLGYTVQKKAAAKSDSFVELQDGRRIYILK